MSPEDTKTNPEPQHVTRLITLEEHFIVPEVNRQFNEIWGSFPHSAAEFAGMEFMNTFAEKSPVMDFGERRLSYMNEGGIDIQVLGYGNNSPMTLNAANAVPLCKQTNDFIAQQCEAHPDRFYGFATLPVADLQAAVDELDRCVNELGFKGALFNGRYNNQWFDDPWFLPLLKKAADLNVPLFFHPGDVAPQVVDEYYRGEWPETMARTFASYGIGWHYDTGIQYIRLVLAGVLDKVPDLKLIFGHWGENIPLYFDRLQTAFPRKVSGLEHEITEYFKERTWVLPSGMFYDLPFQYCYDFWGPDHMMWADDFPYLPYLQPTDTRDFLESRNIPFEDKEKIAHKNAEKLLGIDPQ